MLFSTAVKSVISNIQIIILIICGIYIVLYKTNPQHAPNTYTVQMLCLQFITKSKRKHLFFHRSFYKNTQLYLSWVEGNKKNAETGHFQDGRSHRTGLSFFRHLLTELVSLIIIKKSYKKQTKPHSALVLKIWRGFRKTIKFL